MPPNQDQPQAFDPNNPGPPPPPPIAPQEQQPFIAEQPLPQQPQPMGPQQTPAQPVQSFGDTPQPPVQPVIYAQAPQGQTFTPDQSASPQQPQPATFAPQNPGNMYNNPQSAAAQPISQPVVGGQFNPQPNAPGNDYYADGAKPGIILGILSIVFGIILPLVGIVLGIIAAIKGFTKNNKLLGILGIVGIILSLVLSVIWITVIGSVFNKVRISGQLVSYTSSKCTSNQYSMSYPKELTGKEETGTTLVLWQSTGDTKDTQSSKEQTISTIEADCIYVGPVTASDVEQKLPEIATSITKEATSAGLKNIQLSSFKPFTSTNVTSDAWSADITGLSENDVQVQGEIVIFLKKDSLYAMDVVAQKTLWTTYLKTWKKSLDSFKAL